MFPRYYMYYIISPFSKEFFLPQWIFDDIAYITMHVVHIRHISGFSIYCKTTYVPAGYLTLCLRVIVMICVNDPLVTNNNEKTYF